LTSTIKSAQNSSKIYHTHPPRDPVIPDDEELLRKEKLTAGNRVSLKTNTRPHGIQQDPNFEKGTTNNVWNITKQFTKHQTQNHTPVIDGRKGLAFTPFDRARAIPYSVRNTRKSF
jgi:hypothetical protein